MVRLHTSLLAVTLAISSALAFSNEHQRRQFDNQVQARQLSSFPNEKDLFGRELDIYDDLEERSLMGSAKFAKFARVAARLGPVGNAATLLSVGKAAVNHFTKNPRSGDYSRGSYYQRRDLYEDLLGRDLDAEDLFGREYDGLDTINDLE